MKQIYIIMSQTGTIVSRIISFFTRAPYNHSSISMEKDLSILFSFGRKCRYNVLNAGFISEHLKTGMFEIFGKGDCCIIEVNIQEEEYDRLKHKLDIFLENAPRYRYNIIGLLTMIFNIGFSRKNHYFCSQFIAELLKDAGVWADRPEKTKPSDFFNLPDRKIIYTGKIENAMIFNSVENDDFQYVSADC